MRGGGANNLAVLYPSDIAPFKQTPNISEHKPHKSRGDKTELTLSCCCANTAICRHEMWQNVLMTKMLPSIHSHTHLLICLP